MRAVLARERFGCFCVRDVGCLFSYTSATQKHIALLSKYKVIGNQTVTFLLVSVRTTVFKQCLVYVAASKAQVILLVHVLKRWILLMYKIGQQHPCWSELLVLLTYVWARVTTLSGCLGTTDSVCSSLKAIAQWTGLLSCGRGVPVQSLSCSAFDFPRQLTRRKTHRHTYIDPLRFYEYWYYAPYCRMRAR